MDGFLKQFYKFNIVNSYTDNICDIIFRDARENAEMSAHSLRLRLRPTDGLELLRWYRRSPTITTLMSRARGRSRGWRY